MEAARQHAAHRDLPLVWDMPVPYTALNPVALELKAARRGGSKTRPQPEGAGSAWLYVEPDGDVHPGQGINKVLGNMLKDDWKKIWKKVKGRLSLHDS